MRVDPFPSIKAMLLDAPAPDAVSFLRHALHAPCSCSVCAVQCLHHLCIMCAVRWWPCARDALLRECNPARSAPFYQMGADLPWDGHVVNTVMKLMHNKLNFERGGKCVCVYARACVAACGRGGVAVLLQRIC